MTATVIFLNIKARVYQDVANSEQLINIIQGGSNEHSVTNQQQNTFTKLQIPQPNTIHSHVFTANIYLSENQVGPSA